MKNQKGLLLAAAVGALFSMTSFAAHSNTNEAKITCAGANACKGQSACKSASNACKGQNSCKGNGIIMTKTEKECTDMGGKVQKS